MTAISEVAAWLKSHDNYLILTHLRPDGDTLGCAGALAQGLRDSGKTAYVLFNPESTPRYSRFVDEYYAPEEYKHEFVITVDTASLDVFPKNGGGYAGAISLSIDHHPSNTLYAEYTYLEEKTASCGEIIYDLLMEMNGSVSAKIADKLYVALSTDTGCFAFGNTTGDTLRVASLLVEAGADHRTLNKQLFRTRTQGRLRMEGMIFSGLEFFFDGFVAISCISREMIEAADADEDDMDDIAALPGSIEGVCVGIIIRELSSTHDCKISVRTKAPYDAQKICAHFGGGGHKLAAGSMIEKTVSEIKAELHEVLKEIM